MSILIVLLSLAAGSYVLAIIERWAVHGHLSLTAPAWAALALMAPALSCHRTRDGVALGRRSSVAAVRSLSAVRRSCLVSCLGFLAT